MKNGNEVVKNKKVVRWSCPICGSNGTIEYEEPGNPYLVGLQGGENHKKVSPDCTVHPASLDFYPSRI